MTSKSITYGAEDVQAERDKYQHLELLYFKDGRDNKNHEHHGIYTGLISKYGRYDD